MTNTDEPPADAHMSILRIDDLRAVLSDVLDSVEARLGSQIEVDVVPHISDYYWTLPATVAFAMDDEPGLAIVAGQTSDDLEELAEMRLDPSMHEVLGHSLEHLAQLLRSLPSPIAHDRHGAALPMISPRGPSPELKRSNRADTQRGVPTAWHAMGFTGQRRVDTVRRWRSGGSS